MASAPPAMPTYQFQQPIRHATVLFGGAWRRHGALGHRRRVKVPAATRAISRAKLPTYGMISNMLDMPHQIHAGGNHGRREEGDGDGCGEDPVIVFHVWLPSSGGDGRGSRMRRTGRMIQRSMKGTRSMPRSTAMTMMVSTSSTASVIDARSKIHCAIRVRRRKPSAGSKGRGMVVASMAPSSHQLPGEIRHQLRIAGPFGRREAEQQIRADPDILAEGRGLQAMRVAPTVTFGLQLVHGLALIVAGLTQRLAELRQLIREFAHAAAGAVNGTLAPVGRFVAVEIDSHHPLVCVFLAVLRWPATPLARPVHERAAARTIVLLARLVAVVPDVHIADVSLVLTDARPAYGGVPGVFEHRRNAAAAHHRLALIHALISARSRPSGTDRPRRCAILRAKFI
ncbi:hypothetical protein Sp245p_31400 (plasmid) [Azospirillum baldaniorum]|uniref:Uncharacterized protein n=1 Tax=Azospirillum baldaniorum TaxID=1064539 RepID=A0A9P1K1H9_9PROT|nr:hypothetical protein Sp245p_31400 [Azospirillum baldaniorum]CCD03817.1 protein of unknown function [Azospirillum baldaniorum]